MTNLQFLQEGYYALGRLELDRGEELTWRERRQFLEDYVATCEAELALKKQDE